MKLNRLTKEVLYDGRNTWRGDIHQLRYHPVSNRLTEVCSLPFISLLLMFEYLLWVLLQCFIFDTPNNCLLWNLQKIILRLLNTEQQEQWQDYSDRNKLTGKYLLSIGKQTC